jgi:hypothetical protein
MQHPKPTTPSSFLMDFREPNPGVFLKVMALFTTVFFALGVVFSIPEFTSYPVYLSSIKLWGFLGVTVFALVLLNGLAFIPRYSKKCFEYISKPGFKTMRWSIALGLLLVASAWILINREYAPFLKDFWVRVFLIQLACLIAWGFLIGLDPEKPVRTFLIPLVWIGVLWTFKNYLPWRPTYPFSLDWTETSWYYFASFFHSQKIYGFQFPWPFLDIGRPLLLSPVFFFPNYSLAAIRIWQSILWFSSALLVSGLMLRRFKLPGVTINWILLGWMFTWMLMGPVYYYLAIVSALVIGGFNRLHYWRNAFWVALASLFGGIFRFNWIIVPSLIACTLYILETPFEQKRGFWKYYHRPITLSLIGIGLGTFSFFIYLQVTGRVLTRWLTKFTSPYLWYRLLPNSNLVTGILPGILLVSAALGILIWLYIRSQKIHHSRWGFLVLFLTGLLGGGLVASSKIGSGFNLHNLDAFIVLLLISGSYTLTSRFVPEINTPVLSPAPWGWILLLFATPTLWLLLNPGSLHFQIDQDAKIELQQLKAITLSVAARGGEELFLSGRHLLTFKLLEGIELVPDYEVQELTEMAMSENVDYLSRFSADLKANRFALIVTRQMNAEPRDLSRPSAEEINAWKKWVVAPILNDYCSVMKLKAAGLEVFAPCSQIQN